MLYFKGDPPEAALCDFGKLYLKKIDTYTGLAAWSNLPPEIVEGNFNPYDQSIDIWMLDLALILTLCSQACQGVARLHNGQITFIGLEVIRSYLQNIKNSTLAQLLHGTLSRDLKSRPNADQALSHLCFQHLKRESTQEAVSSDGKRRHSEEDAVNVKTATN